VLCGPYPDSAAASMPVSTRMQLNTCVADYQMKGYRTVPSPNRIPGPAVGF